MTQEKKDLLIKDLCTRLPYGVRIAYRCNQIHELRAILKNGLVMIADIITNEYVTRSVENIIPYLFPLSNMTEEQYYEMQSISGKDCMEHMEVEKEWRNNSQFNHLPLYQHRVIEFFHKHHFDYRGLIPMGLANDATGLNIY